MKLKFPKPRKPNKRKTRYRKGLDGKQHEFIYGLEAHLKRRAEIYKSCGGIVSVWPSGEVVDLRYANCGLCKPTHLLSWIEGHWVHLEKRHCDCVSCSTFGCKAAHSKLHHGGRSFL